MNYGDDCEALEAVDLHDVDVDAWHDAYDDDYVEAARAEAAERERAVAEARERFAWATNYAEVRAEALDLLDDAALHADAEAHTAAYYGDHREAVELRRHAEQLRRKRDELRGAHELSAACRAVELLDPDADGWVLPAAPQLHALIAEERDARRAEAAAAMARRSSASVRKQARKLPLPTEVDASHRRRRAERCPRPPGFDRPAASPRQATAPPASTSCEVGYPAHACA